MNSYYKSIQNTEKINVFSAQLLVAFLGYGVYLCSLSFGIYPKYSILVSGGNSMHILEAHLLLHRV